MLKKHMMACAMATVLVAAPVFAQTTSAPATDRPAPPGAAGTTSGSPVMQPGASGEAAGTASGMTGTATGGPMDDKGAGQSTSIAPLAVAGPGQMLGSDLRGTRVYGVNNENVGSINDIVVDRKGQLIALIVGVGGFLGMGQKDVAIPFQAVEIVSDRTLASAAGNGAGDPATTGTTGASVGTTFGGAGAPATAGRPAPSGAAPGGTINPDRIVLRHMTKADLEGAPEFRSGGRRTTSGTDATGTTGGAGAGGGMATPGGGTAPRQ